MVAFDSSGISIIMEKKAKDVERLKEINARDITKLVRDLCIKSNIPSMGYPGKDRKAPKKNLGLWQGHIERILTNIRWPEEEQLPACQDTDWHASLLN